MNKFIKDRKTLSLVLCLVLVCVFTLTVAYSALNAVLTIQGNARVSAADWDIYLNNPRVTNGSATTDVPVIKTSSTLEFETTLNMPGDFYEFIVDVVNGGDIDAMIENVVKTPDLTAEQAKFLKYEVSYQNGEAITTKQLLAKDTTMPIKVRVEYRKDLSNNDLPTGQVVLDLSLTLEYVQSDGTGTSVNNNGVYKVVSANGDVNEIGTIVTIGSEQFYTIGTEGNNVKLLAMYNLYAGGVVNDYFFWTPYGDEATGIQSSTMKGRIREVETYHGTLSFSETNYWDEELEYPAYVYNSNSNLYKHVEYYKTFINSLGVYPSEARLISIDELISLGCSMEEYSCNGYADEWVHSVAYWSGTSYSSGYLWAVTGIGEVGENGNHSVVTEYGVRPVIVISKDYFN